MVRCGSCERELAPTWKFCVSCGRPVTTATSKQIRQAFAEAGDGRRTPRQRKRSNAFWAAVGIGALGLLLISLAAVQLYGTVR